MVKLTNTHDRPSAIVLLALLIASFGLVAQDRPQRLSELPAEGGMQSQLPAGAWDTLEKAQGIIVGSGEPIAQVVFDPNCPYSAVHYYHLRRFFPDITTRWIPVSYYKNNSFARSRAILNTDDPAKALEENFENYDYQTQQGAYPLGHHAMALPGWSDQEFKKQLEAWLHGTPATIIRTPEGAVLMHPGALQDRTWIHVFRALFMNLQKPREGTGE